MIRVLCLLAFVFANFQPVYANGNHDHGHKKGHGADPTPTEQPSGGDKKNRTLEKLIIIGGVAYIGYSWGSAGSSGRGATIGVKVKEAQ